MKGDGNKMARRVKDMERQQQQAAMSAMSAITVGGAGTKPINGGASIKNVHKHNMKIKSKNGMDVDINISGTQENPKITAKKFNVQGKTVSGEATIQHWKHKGVEEGLYFRKSDVYMQCASAMPKIKNAISNLPPEKYYAQKTENIIDSDGYKIPVQKWLFDKPMETEKGTTITEDRMASFLDSKKIEKIEIDDAIKMWADEREAVYIRVNRDGNKRAQAIFDDDVVDVGYKQACENAGIPKHLQ